jgi:hypothetical protein
MHFKIVPPDKRHDYTGLASLVMAAIKKATRVRLFPHGKSRT